MARNDQDLDSILIELGEFGKYQKIHYIYMSVPIFLLAGFTLSYVFTAGNIDYRCLIPECMEKSNQTIEYNSNWIQYAIPYRNGKPAKCRRYAYQNESIRYSNNTHNNNNNNNNNYNNNNNTCTINNFDRSTELKCNELTYRTDEVTIANEFNIVCEENDWKLAMIGSINNIAQFIFMPIGGYVSDRFGRRTLFLTGLLCSTLFGLLRSLSTNYYMFAAMEFFDAGMGSGTYSSAFILGLEMVGPSKRVMGSILLSCSYSIGEALLAILAMYTRNFRIFLRWIYAPALLLVCYFWIIPESVRWLMITGRKDRATTIIMNAAKINKVKLSDVTMQKLKNNSDSLLYNELRPLTTTATTTTTTDTEKLSKTASRYPILDVLHSRILLIRILICSYCWLTNTLVYYGLGLNAVTLAGNKYINFVFVSLAEIPGYVITYYVMQRYGRRHCLCGSLLICGIVCATSELLPSDAVYLKLMAFFLGKCAILVSFTVLYIYTAELYPTNLRHSLLSGCSMVGRIGSIIAPLTPLLARYVQSLPLLIFGGTAITSGLLILNFPETLNVKLPDTIEEAEQMQNKSQREESFYTNEPVEKSVF